MTDSPQQSNPPTLKHYKILIVEDDDQLQKSYNKLFTSEGFRVFQALNGQQGLDLARTEMPQIILLDIMLPGGLNGFDVLEQLKKDRDLYNIPVVMLTNLDGERESALAIGATAYLVKANTSIEELTQKVKDCLKLGPEVLPTVQGIPNHIGTQDCPTGDCF